MYQDEISFSGNRRQNQEQSTGGPHKDYESNLTNAKAFCARVQKSLLKGMKVYICGSHGLENSLLMITFSPPRSAKMGNYATPIFLHQSRLEVNKQIENIFNAYMKMAKKFWDGEDRKGDMLHAANL